MYAGSNGTGYQEYGTLPSRGDRGISIAHSSTSMSMGGPQAAAHKAIVPSWIAAIDAAVADVCTPFVERASDHVEHITRTHFLLALAITTRIPIQDYPGNDESAAAAAVTAQIMNYLDGLSDSERLTVTRRIENQARTITPEDIESIVHEDMDKLNSQYRTGPMAMQLFDRIPSCHTRISTERLQTLLNVYPPPNLRGIEHQPIKSQKPEYLLCRYIAYAIAKLAERSVAHRARKTLSHNNTASAEEQDQIADFSVDFSFVKCMVPPLTEQEALAMFHSGKSASKRVPEQTDFDNAARWVALCLLEAMTLSSEDEAVGSGTPLRHRCARIFGVTSVVVIIALSFTTLLASDALPLYNWAVVFYNIVLIMLALYRAAHFAARTIERKHSEYWRCIGWVVCYRRNSDVRRQDDQAALLQANSSPQRPSFSPLPAYSNVQTAGFADASATAHTAHAALVVAPSVDLIDAVDSKTMLGWLKWVLYITLLGVIVDNAVDTFFHTPANGDAEETADLAADASNFLFGVVTVASLTFLGDAEPRTPYGSIFWSWLFGLNIAMLIQDVFLDISGTHLQNIPDLLAAQPSLTTWAATFRLYGCAIAAQKYLGTLTFSQNAAKPPAGGSRKTLVMYGVRAQLLTMLAATCICVSILIVTVAGLALAAEDALSASGASAYVAGWSLVVPLGLLVLGWIWWRAPSNSAFASSKAPGSFTFLLVALTIVAAATVVVANLATAVHVSSDPAVDMLFFTAAIETICQTLQHSADLLSGGEVYKRMFNANASKQHTNAVIRSVLFMLCIEFAVNILWLVLDFLPSSQLDDVVGGIPFANVPWLQRWCKLMSMLFRGVCLLVSSMALMRVLTAAGRYAKHPPKATDAFSPLLDQEAGNQQPHAADNYNSSASFVLAADATPVSTPSGVTVPLMGYRR